MALAYWLRPTVAITVDYGQAPAQGEITASKVLCDSLRIRHELVQIDCSSLGRGSMLPDAAKQPVAEWVSLAPTPEWWPFRNQLIITFAAARAIGLGLSELAIGTVSTDRDHRDGFPEFVASMDELLRLQEGELALRAPAIQVTSAELVRASGIPMELLAWSHSCYRSALACGSCRGCEKHQRVLMELGQW